MNTKEIEFSRRWNDLQRESEAAAKETNCPICGKKQSSFCNSHSVPQFILDTIKENGMILQSTATAFPEYPLRHKKGLNNTGTFHLICRDCDSHIFSDYENPDNLLFPPTNRMMAEIALKNILLNLAKQYKDVELYRIVQERYHSFRSKAVGDYVRSIDIRDYLHSFRRTKKIIDKNLKSGFEIIHWDILPYITPIAVQTSITLHRSPNKNIINDVYNYSETNRIEQVHLCVFPLVQGTVVMMFYHKDDRKLFRFKREFLRLKDTEKIEFINYIIFKYSEDYYFSPTIEETIKNNQYLRQLSRENYDAPNLGYVLTPIEFETYKQVGFRQIPNFLSPEYKIKTDS